MPKPDTVNSYRDLAKLTIKRLRELTAADTQIANTTALSKPDLLDALAEVYGFERPKQARAEEIKQLKAAVKTNKSRRDELLQAAPAARDATQLQRARQQIKRIKRRMRKVAKAS